MLHGSPEDLARGAPGQRGPDLDDAGNLEIGDPAAAELDDLGLVAGLREHDDGLDQLVAVVAVHAHDRGLAHLRMCLQQLLDLVRIDLEASAIDEERLPALEIEPAGAVLAADVSREEAAVAERGRRP